MTASECVERLGVIALALEERLKAATLEHAKETMALSQNKYVPVLTGKLKESGSVSAHDEVIEYKAVLSYSIHYAIWVHEQPKPHSNPASASWKYLQIPLTELAPQFIEKLKVAQTFI